MNKTYPSTEVWIQTNHQLQKNISNNYIQEKDLTSLNFAFEDLALFQHQLSHAINLWKSTSISQNDFMLLKQQLPLLLQALHQNLSTLTTMLILDLFILMAFKYYDIIVKDLIQNFGVPYLLKRLQDENLEVSQKSFKLVGIIPKKYLNDIEALPILLRLTKKIKIESNDFFDIIIEIARYTKRKAHLQLVCQYILKLNTIEPQIYLKKIVYFLSKSCDSTEVSKILLENHIIRVLNKIYNNQTFNGQQKQFYCISLISLLQENQQQSSEFTTEKILIFFNLPVDKHNYNLTELYSKSLYKLTFHNSNLIKEVIKNQQILNNLFNFYDQKALDNFTQIFNRVIEFDLDFEINYLIKKGVLSKYYAQLNRNDLSINSTLQGIYQLLQKGYIKDNLNQLQKKVRNSSVQNLKDKNIVFEIVRLIQQEKQ